MHKMVPGWSWLVPSGPGWLDDGPFMFLVMVSGDLWRLFDLEENAAGIAERGFHDAAFTIRQNRDLKRFPAAAQRKKERIFVNELRLQIYLVILQNFTEYSLYSNL